MLRTLLLAGAVAAVTLAGYWRLFEKAGVAGWKALVPIYRTYITLAIISRPNWWLILMLVPLANIVVASAIAIDLAECFGKPLWYAAGLVLLPVVFVPMLGFGSASYRRIR